MAQSKDVRLVTEAKLDASNAGLKAGVASDLAPVKTDVAALKVLGGLTPGSVNDATSANLIKTPTTETAKALSAAIGESIASALAPPDLHRISAHGDSITEGGHDGGYSWPAMVSTALSGTIVNNRGRGGWTSTEVAIRQGGVTPTLAGFTLPASTDQVAVTVTWPTASYRTSEEIFFIWQGELRFGDKSIPGTLRHRINSTATPVNGWTFHRATAGASEAIPAGAPFVCTELDIDLSGTEILSVGRNNVFVGGSERIAPDVAAMVKHLGHTAYLVLGVTNSSSEAAGSTGHTRIIEANSLLASIHGGRFLDIRRFLIDHGLAVNNAEPTSADTAAIAADKIPPTLLTSDGVHPNKWGYFAIATAVLGRLEALALTSGPIGALPVLPAPIPPEPPVTEWFWDADTFSATADGAAMPDWVSEAGGVKLAPPLENRRPTITTIAGKKWVRFDGVDDFIEATGLSLAQPYTVMVRARFRGLSEQTVPQGLMFPTSGSGSSIKVLKNGELSIATAPSGTYTSSVGTVAGDADTVIGVAFNGATSVYSKDGAAPVSAGTALLAGSPMGGYRLGHTFDTASRFASIDVQGVRIYSHALNASEFAAAAAAMNA